MVKDKPWRIGTSGLAGYLKWSCSFQKVKVNFSSLIKIVAKFSRGEESIELSRMMSCNFILLFSLPLIIMMAFCKQFSPLKAQHYSLSLFSQKAIAILVALSSSPQVWTFSFFCTQTCWSLLILTLAVSKFSNQIPNFPRKNWEQRTCGVWQFVGNHHKKSNQIRTGPL